MTWHIIARIGALDTYVPDSAGTEPRLITTFEHPSDRDYVPNNVLQTIRDCTGLEPSPVALDLLHFAMAVYSADLRINRKHGADRWARDLTLHLPVSDPSLWMRVTPQLTRTLGFLTGDSWDFEFRTRPPHQAPPLEPVDLPAVDVVSLFSGGLDSLVGAIDLLARDRCVALVGHHGAGMTNSVQTGLLKRLTQRFAERLVPFMFYVQPPRSDADDGEHTMRSRSILFLSLGAAVTATLGGGKRLIVAENGLISLNVPLTRTRIGSSSTRTTHPHFLALFRDFLAAIGIAVHVETPYKFATKGEMLRGCAAQEVLRELAPHSMSCSHPEAGRFQGRAPGVHCGYCLPCIIRRASLDAAGCTQNRYSIDITTSPPANNSDTARDLRAFQMALERLRGAPRMRYLFDVLGTGPIPPGDAAGYAGVYHRGMEEVRALLG